MSGIIDLLCLKVTRERGEGNPSFLTPHFGVVSHSSLAFSALSPTVSISTPALVVPLLLAFGDIKIFWPICEITEWNQTNSPCFRFYSSSTQNYFNSTETELKISYLKLSDIKDLQTEEIKWAQNWYCLIVGLVWMLSCSGNTWAWRRSKESNQVGRDWQFFEETDFVHMWSCNMSSKKFSLKAPSVSFLTPKGHFGTQTSYHSYSTITLWTFSRGKFSKGG